MLRDIVLCALGLAMPLQFGCGPSVRFGPVGVSPEQGAHPEVIADVEAASFPVAYVWRGSAQIIGRTVYPAKRDAADMLLDTCLQNNS